MSTTAEKPIFLDDLAKRFPDYHQHYTENELQAIFSLWYEIEGKYEGYQSHENQKNLLRLEEAFYTMLIAHKHDKRKSGEPYVMHPLRVTYIVAYDMRMSAITASAALMHDVVEDCPGYDLAYMKEHFGETIADIIDGVTKVDTSEKEWKDNPKSTQIKRRIKYLTQQKVIISSVKDQRGVAIKLADRLDNMRTIEHMRPEKQKEKAQETFNVYVPLASFLGLNPIKNELEDISLRILDPERHQKIYEQLKEYKAQNEGYFNEVSAFLEDYIPKLNQNYPIKIHRRIKSIHSIDRKMRVKGVRFGSIYDIYAFRIVCDCPIEKEREILWRIFAHISAVYPPKADRIRDWISYPKRNSYASLHMTVRGPKGKWVEIQIRSQRMHWNSERGLAAHYRYTASVDSVAPEDLPDTRLNNLKEFYDTQDLGTLTLMESSLDMSIREDIPVFSPREDVYMLPLGSTVLDYAFRIHTQLGENFEYALVNGQEVPMDYKLRAYETVEIFSGSVNNVSPLWMRKIITARAKQHIRQSIRKKHQHDIAIGRRYLHSLLRRYILQNNPSSFHASMRLNIKEVEPLLEKYFHVKRIEELYRKVRLRQVRSDSIRSFVSEHYNISSRLLNRVFVRKPKEIELHYINSILFGEMNEVYDYEMGACCQPFIGDDVTAVELYDALIVHKAECDVLKKTLPKEHIHARWDTSETPSFDVKVRYYGENRVKLVIDILQIIAKYSIDVKDISSERSFKGNSAKGMISFNVPDYKTMNKITKDLRKIKPILKLQITT